MKVLLTGAGALLGQGILKSLRASSLCAHIIAVDPCPLSAGLYWADEAHLVPMADDPAYLPRIRELLDHERPDAVLIGTDVELPIFAREREQLEREFGMHIIVGSSKAVAIADDKWLTAQFFAEHGFDHPLSCLPGDENHLIDTVGFPLIVKPRVGARSVGVRHVSDRAELRAALREGGSDVLIQECVGTPNEEYTASALCFDGRCAASIVMRRDLRDGNTYRAFADEYPELNAMVRLWADAFQSFGPANFQFRIDAEGRAKVFEINARFSGTTPLRALAGFNEVEMVLRHVLLGERILQPRPKRIVILRHWSDTVVEPEKVAELETERAIAPIYHPAEGAQAAETTQPAAIL